MSRTAPIISEPKKGVAVRNDFEEKVDAGLVIDAGVEEDVVENVLFEWALVQCHCQTTESAPQRSKGAAKQHDQVSGRTARPRRL